MEVKKKRKLCNDLRDGWFLFYNEDESLREECSYLRGVKNGGYKFYHKGYLFNEDSYLNGEKTGTWKTYNFEGKINLETNEY